MNGQIGGILRDGDAWIGVPAGTGVLAGTRAESGQVVVRAVSSTTKEVCSMLSSVPVNFSVTVCPM